MLSKSCTGQLKGSSARIYKIPCKIFVSQCEGTRYTCKCSSWYLAFCSSFCKELVSIEQHCLGDRVAELLGWLHVPGWGTEQELNTLNKEFLSSLFSSLMVNKGLPLQILWTCEHGNRSRGKHNTFCASGASWKPRNFKTPKVNVHVSSTLFVSLPIDVKGHFRPPTLLGSN